MRCFLRIGWRTVAAIVTRVIADGRCTGNLLAGLTWIGTDEIGYRKGHRYLTAVVDHTSGRLVWATQRRNQDTLGRCFDQLDAKLRFGPERRRRHTVAIAADHDQLGGRSLPGREVVHYGVGEVACDMKREYRAIEKSVTPRPICAAPVTTQARTRGPRSARAVGC